jgi:ATP-dependent Clp protease ATP-binding subunit ClpA
VVVPEPTVEEAYEILQGLRERYETHHKLRYLDEALMAAAKYSSQYISDRFLPDKAIDLIDEAGSRVRLRHIQLPEEARDLDKELKQVIKVCSLARRLRVGRLEYEGSAGWKMKGRQAGRWRVGRLEDGGWC